MLCLTRYPNQRFIINGDIDVAVDRLIDGDPRSVQFAVTAPAGMSVFIRRPMSGGRVRCVANPESLLESVLLGRGGGQPVLVTRFLDQVFHIGPVIRVHAIYVGSDRARVGIHAPGMSINRPESPAPLIPRSPLRPVIKLVSEVAR